MDKPLPFNPDKSKKYGRTKRAKRTDKFIGFFRFAEKRIT